MKIYLKILFLNFALFMYLWLWKIIKLFRWNKNIDLKNIKKIIFNRKDRIWDAVIAKPFIILFSKYIKEELKLDIEIEVECSKYNEFIFNDKNNNQYYNLKPIDTELITYWIKILPLIKYFLGCLYIQTIFKRKKINKNKKCNSVYVDLVWDYKTLLNKMEDKNLWLIWPNLGLNNYLLDFSITNSYVGQSNINLIESYINLIWQCFELRDFRKYVYKNINSFFEDYNNWKKSGLLIFVWNKEYRNLSVYMRYKLILNISNILKDEKITVLDDNSNIIYNELKKYKFPDNVELLKNGMILDEVKELAKKFRLIIWIDGWWFNYIRTVTDSLEIFTLGNPNVRSIFIWDEKYKTQRFWRYIYKESSLNWKFFGYVYKVSPILPSLDFSVPKNMFHDFPTIDIWKIIQRHL